MVQESQKRVDVIIPIFNAYSTVQDCINSVLEHFDDQARLILINDCSDDDRIAPYLQSVKENSHFPVYVYNNSYNKGFIKTVNWGMELSEDNDVILLNSDTIVTKNWVRKLRKVAYRKGNIATVTPLSNNATIFSIPEFCKSNELPQGYDVPTFAEFVEEHSLCLYPEVPTGHGFCLYIKRTAINLLGLFDENYGRGYEEENDFCMRVLSYSLCNVMADDTFIYHAGGVSYKDQERKELEERNRQFLLNKYPFYLDLIRFYCENRPVQIWEQLQAKINGLRVGLDGRCLNDKLSGTQRYLLELINAYTEMDDLSVDLLVSDRARDKIYNLLEKYNINPFPRLIEESELDGKIGSNGWDIFHVTFQGISLPDVATIRDYSKRVINTFQDSILAKNPAYFQNFSGFTDYYYHLKSTLESIDGVIAISDYIQDELLTSYFIDPQRVKTISHGVNAKGITESSLVNQDFSPKRYLLFIGNDFLHKNLEATVKVWKETRKQGYDYQLVLVGNAVVHGGIKDKMKAELASESNVFFLDQVDDQQLGELYRQAGVLLYLSNSEGFGLPPLEAFANDCPVIASNLTSIPEVVGEAAACFHPGEIKKIASEAIALIEDSQKRDRAIQKGRERVKQFDWHQTAKETLNFYYHLLRLSPHPYKNFPSLHLKSQQLETTKAQLQQSQDQILAMESSKFWKLRQQWFMLKSVLGLSNGEERNE